MESCELYRDGGKSIGNTDADTFTDIFNIETCN